MTRERVLKLAEFAGFWIVNLIVIAAIAAAVIFAAYVANDYNQDTGGWFGGSDESVYISVPCDSPDTGNQCSEIDTGQER